MFTYIDLFIFSFIFLFTIILTCRCIYFTFKAQVDPIQTVVPWIIRNDKLDAQKKAIDNLG